MKNNLQTHKQPKNSRKLVKHKLKYISNKTEKQEFSDELSLLGEQNQDMTRVIDSHEVNLPEIGLNKFRDIDIMKEVVDPINPFKIEKNTEKFYVLGQRNREIHHIERLKRQMLNLNPSLLSTEPSRQQFISMSSITKKAKSFMENKRDRSGAIRTIQKLAAITNDQTRNADIRSVTEVRLDSKLRDRKNSLIEDILKGDSDIKKVNIIQDYQAYLNIQNDDIKNKLFAKLNSKGNLTQTQNDKSHDSMNPYKIAKQPVSPFDLGLGNDANSQIESRINEISQLINEKRRSHMPRVNQTLNELSNLNITRDHSQDDLYDQIINQKLAVLKNPKQNSQTPMKFTKNEQRVVLKKLQNEQMQTQRREAASVRTEFVENSRQIFYKKIQMKDKAEFLGNLYKTLENDQEKLIDARKEMELDYQKFQRYLEKEEQDKVEVHQALEKVHIEKQMYDQKAIDLETQIQEVSDLIKLTDEQLSPLRDQKEFIENLAEEFIYSKKRKLLDFRRQQTLIRDKDGLNEKYKKSVDSSQDQRIFKKNKQVNKEVPKQKGSQKGSGFFITQEKADKNNFRSKPKSNMMNQIVEQQENNISKDSFEDLIENDLDPEDVTNDIPFSRESFLQVMRELEESNLFLINVVDHDELSLEKIMKESETKLKSQQIEINKVQESIDHFEDLLQKQQFKKELLFQIITGKSVQSQPQSSVSNLIDKLRDLYIKSYQGSNLQKSADLVVNMSLSHLLVGLEQRMLYIAEALDYQMKDAELNNPQMRRKIQEVMKRQEFDKKHKKEEMAKIKEREVARQRYERNMEKLKRTENIKINVGCKVDKLRSRKPRKIKLVKKEERSQEDFDYNKYVNNI